MKYMFKYSLIASVALLAASLAMFVASAWTGDSLASAINTIQFVLVLLAVAQAYILFSRLDKGTIVHRLWGLVSVAMSVVLVGVVCELINGYAGEWKIPQDVVLLVYLVVWLILLAYPFFLYSAFRSTGLPLDWRAISRVVPSLAILGIASMVVVLIPLATSDLDAGTKVSNFVAIIVGLVGVGTSAVFTMTMGRGRAGKPWLFIGLTFLSIVIQTIITTQVTMVAGSMRVLEPANFFLQLGYVFLIAGEYYQYQLIAE